MHLPLKMTNWLDHVHFRILQSHWSNDGAINILARVIVLMFILKNNFRILFSFDLQKEADNLGRNLPWYDNQTIHNSLRWSDIGKPQCQRQKHCLSQSWHQLNVFQWCLLLMRRPSLQWNDPVWPSDEYYHCQIHKHQAFDSKEQFAKMDILIIIIFVKNLQEFPIMPFTQRWAHEAITNVQNIHFVSEIFANSE